MLSIAHVFKTFALFFLATMVAAVPQTIEGKVAALDFKVDKMLEGMAKHVKADNVKAKARATPPTAAGRPPTKSRPQTRLTRVARSCSRSLGARAPPRPHTPSRRAVRTRPPAS